MTTGDAILRRPGEGRPIGVGADRAIEMVEASATDDAFSLIEYTAAPGVPGPPLHVHHVVSETFYVLEGSVDFRVEGRTERLTPGSLVFVPPGIPHTFANTGGAVARWVGIFSPGRYAALLDAIGAAFPAGGGPPDETKLMEAFASHDVEVVPE